MDLSLISRSRFVNWAIIVCLTLCGFFLGSWQKLYRVISFDTWWHLSQGREIFRGNFWLDSTSFVAFGQPNHSHSWLYDAILFKVYEFFSLEGMIYLTLILGVILFHYQLTLARYLGASHGIGILVGILSWYVSIRFFLARPQQLTPIFLLILILLLSSIRGFRLYAGVTVLFLLWANCHGSFILGIGFIVGCIFLSLLPQKIDSNEQSGSLTFLDGLNKIPSRTYLSILLFCILGCIIHPKGIFVFQSAFAHDPFNIGINRLIDEWQPVFFRENPFVYFLIGIGLFLCRKPINRTSIILALFCALPLFAARHVPIFCSVCLPLISARIRFSTLNNRVLLRHATLLLFASITIGFTTHFPIRQTTTTQLLELLPTIDLKDTLPISATKFIHESVHNGRIFTLYEHGGFVGFILDGDSKVFIDSRVQPFTYENLMDYLTVIEDPKSALNIAHRYQFSHMILPASLSLPLRHCSMFQDKEWNLFCPTSN